MAENVHDEPVPEPTTLAERQYDYSRGYVDGLADGQASRARITGRSTDMVMLLIAAVLIAVGIVVLRKTLAEADRV